MNTNYTWHFSGTLVEPSTALESTVVVPEEICTEIDLSINAPEWFISAAIDLELDTKKGAFKTRAQKALAYIKAKGTLNIIDYPTLIKYLATPSSVNIEIWRQLYLLERSIEPRSGDKYSWVMRLKMFCNTYLLEHAVVKSHYKPFPNDPKKGRILLIKGNQTSPIDHDNLHAGRGNFGADMYFFDDSIEGSIVQKMQKVEFKVCPFDSVAEGARYYAAGNNQTYGANYLIMFWPEDCEFYWVNFEKHGYKQISHPKLKAPANLFDIVRK